MEKKAMIDKSAVMEQLRAIERNGKITDAQKFRQAKFVVENAPTIEAEPVQHGRWIEKPPYKYETVKGLEFQIVCSRCDEQNASIKFDENHVPIAKSFWTSRFCPNCGALMDGGAKMTTTEGGGQE